MDPRNSSAQLDVSVLEDVRTLHAASDLYLQFSYFMPWRLRPYDYPGYHYKIKKFFNTGSEQLDCHQALLSNQSKMIYAANIPPIFFKQAVRANISLMTLNLNYRMLKSLIGSLSGAIGCNGLFSNSDSSAIRYPPLLHI